MERLEQLKHPGRVFYGWRLVGSLVAILFFTGGAGFYVFPVFIGPMQEEFGWSMTQISGSAAVWAIMFGFSSPLIGALIERFGARKTMLAAAMLASAVNLGFSVMQELWHLYVINMLAGFVVAGITLVPSQTLVTNWFDKYRGRAMAVTMLGIAFGGSFLPSFNEYLISRWGWRFAWVFAFVILWLVVIPLIFFFIRTKPSELGMLPDGATHREAASSISGLSLKRAVATSSFWLLFTVFVLQLFGVSLMNFHFVPFATQQAEFGSDQAAFFYGLSVAFSIIGRLLFGWLADRYKPALMAAIAVISSAIGPLVIELVFIRAGVRDLNLFWLYAAPYGIGLGGFAVVFPLLVGRCFGERHFSKIMGLTMSGFALGILIGILGAGKIFDATGSYEWAFIACAFGLLLSAVLVTSVRPERYRKEFVNE